MNITLEPVKIEERQILQNLSELFIYEGTQHSFIDVNDAGLYDALDDLDLYWTDENKHPFFIKVDGKLAGFVMVFDGRQIEEIESDYAIDEFFIMYKYKRQGIGRYCLNHILDTFKGKWQIWFHPRNEAAKHFWTNTIDEYTGGKYEVVQNTEPFFDGSIGNTLVFDS